MELLKEMQVNKEDAVLLIVDVQEKLMPAMDHREQLYKNTRILLTAAGQLRLPVVVTEQYPKGLGRTVEALAALLPEDRKLLEKTSFNAAADGLLELLAELGRKTVLVCGAETHVCVYQTVRSLLSSGYRVFPIQDAMCSRATHNYKSGLRLMDRMGAVVITVETAAFDLLKVAGTPEFKVVSKALK